MKFIAKLILTIVFIPVFLIFLFAVSLRFQLLASSFWENTFNSGDVYSKLSISINKNLESQAVSEGGRASDVKILTDLISPENLRDTISKNINNLLQYANGKAGEIIVYVPVNKIPKSLLSKNFGGVTEQIRLTDLLKEFNMYGITTAQIRMISRIGLWTWVSLIIVALLLLLLQYLLYLCTNPSRRLIASGVALILSGIVALLVTASGTIIRINWTKDLVGSSNVGDSIIGIVASPVIQGVLSVWLLFAIIAMVLGVVLLFLKKPVSGKLK
jgi:hypothetical protein